MAFLAPLFLAGLAALAVPIFVHLINRERKEITEFPSLMFLERIPYRSVRRQKIRDWLLFAMRCLALILLIAAFARPFLERRFQDAAGALDSAREVVILLDRSWSMGYGDRWTRAQDAARAAIDDVGANDRATIVAFSESPQALSQPTSDKASLRASLATVKLSSRRTEYDAALKLASKIIDESPLARREVVLISDFQKVGWDGHEEVELPPGTKLTNVDLSQPDPSNLSVAGIEIHRSLETGRERVAVKARLTNTGAKPATGISVVLELNDRVIERKTLTVAANGSGTVDFTGVPLPPGITKGRVTAGKDVLPQDNDFNFVVAPDQALSVLIVEPADARSTQSFFLTTALSLGDRPLMRSDVKRSSALTFGDLAGRSLVVLNDVPYPGGDMGRRLKTFVEQGGGLLVVLGQNSTAGSWVGTGSDLLPGAVGQIVDRGSQRAGTLTSLEYAHPVFELFSGPRSGDFSSARVYRYRPVAMTNPATVLARYDDGAPALIEKQLGKGRVLILTSTMDDFWNDLAKRPVYVPFVHQMVKYASTYADVRPWFVAGQVMEVGRVAQQLSGAGSGPAPAPRSADGGEFVAESPSGQTIRPSTGDDGHVIELEEQGFYDIRQAGGSRTTNQAVAVNLDMEESDLSRVDPQELAGAVAPRSGDGYRAGIGAPPTPEEQERRQTLWWYLLVGALLLLGSETVLSNRLSRVPR
jgi:uncharacterized membrane protein